MRDREPTPPGQESARFLTAAAGVADGEDHAAEAEALAVELARLFHDDKCTQVTVLDVRGLSPVTNYLVIGTGTSERQMRSVLDHAVELAESKGLEPYRVTRDPGAHWLIADFIDVVAHLFEPNTRSHYDLEMLWGDAREVRWARPGQPRSET